MLIDTWHHYLLLRPLLVFVLATPLIVCAVLVRGPGRPRNPESGTHDSSEAQEAMRPATCGDPRLESETGVAASPRGCPVAAPGSDRRAA